jgi:membrane-associated phospholipid phosphatase
MVGTFAMGALRHDKLISSTGWDMGEAVVLGTLSATAFKTLTGRRRPNESALHGRFGQGGDSFPSGHVTAVFAAAQVFADEMPPEQWGWRVLAYGLAGATVYARLDSNVHWLSDTVAGAALGIATGRFISGRSQSSKSRVQLWVAPLDRGALLTFAIDTN